MGLPWVRLDSSFPMNHKLLALVDDKKWQSITVYICGLAYSGHQGTDGFIPASSLVYLHGTRRNAGDLLEVGLWTACQAGYEINDWDVYQPSTDEHHQRKAKARAAAEERWRRARLKAVRPHDA